MARRTKMKATSASRWKRGGRSEYSVGYYASYRGTWLADQSKANRTGSDLTELESNSTTNRRWEIRLTSGPHQSAKGGKGAAAGLGPSWAAALRRPLCRAGHCDAGPAHPVPCAEERKAVRTGHRPQRKVMFFFLSSFLYLLIFKSISNKIF
jgi:hypothetical protein